jgi:hypothetical protein
VNCREAERLIDTFYDGELDGRSMRDAAMHITRCKRCEGELNERERIQKLLSATIEGEIADIDLDRIWAAVEPTLAHAPPRGLPSLRRLGWVGENAPAAARSARIGGLLGRNAIESEPDGELDPAQWAVPGARRGRLWQWSLAGGAALAASVLLALALVPSGPGGRSAETRVQAALRDGERPAASTEIARTQSQPQAVAQRAPVVTGSAAPFDLARTELPHPARAANKQVQVDSVNFPRSSVAMWSEPASDTTVIWVEDEELAATGRR